VVAEDSTAATVKVTRGQAVITVTAMFTGFQVNLYADDVEPGVAFYAALGFEETYRYAPAGEPLHVELRSGGLTIGIASVGAARDEHGLEVSQEGGAMEIVLWCEDVDAAYAQALAAGATAMREPHDFQEDRLRVGWVMDPLGNPLELVQDRQQ
jgi:predicted enzyme related to lactoylglutathione lyase